MRIHETPSRVAVAACATNGALTTNNAAHNVLTIQGVGCRGYDGEVFCALP
jgi:hypothetical protein